MVDEGIVKGLHVNELKEAKVHLLQLEKSDEDEEKSNSNSRWENCSFGIHGRKFRLQ